MPTFISSVAIGLLCFLTTLSYAQEENSSHRFIVVVSAYSTSNEGLALDYQNDLMNKVYEADLVLSTSKTWLYIYVASYQNFDDAVSKMRQLRKTSPFKEAWVYLHKSWPKSESSNTKEQDAFIKDDKEELTPPNLDNITDQDSAYQSNIINEPQPDHVASAINEKIDIPDNEQVKSNEIMKAEAEALPQIQVVLVNATNRKEVDGKINIIDTDRASKIDDMQNSAWYSLKHPNSGSGDLTLLTQPFGFRKTQFEINYDSLWRPSERYDIDSTATGPIYTVELVRYRKGDIVTMYNVFFYNDSDIMKPESKYEIKSLYDLLHENLGINIRIHGHVNGNGSGKIIPRTSNYFDINTFGKVHNGSAKELSRRRAQTITDYLTDQGIAAERMEVKAWGGRRMLYDKLSPQANQNVRVEIEIISE